MAANSPPHPARAALAATALILLAAPSAGHEPGWSYSPLPGEGDRAALGCDREATAADHACLAVRCEDDYAVGVHVLTTRPAGDGGPWEMTVDRESRVAVAGPDPAPYGGRFADDDDAEWLLDRLRHGSFVYLRHAADDEAPFRFIDLTGSLQAIHTALRWCAPRVPAETGDPPSP